MSAAIYQGRSLADRAARSVGARAVALGTLPSANDSSLVPQPRYQAMASRFGLTLTEQLTCGFHVHVGIDSAQEGVAVVDRIRIWLPVLLALSANSPFWHGIDSGYASYRYQVWNRWPTAGPCEVFGSEAEYRRQVRVLMDTGVLLDEGMVYFDARLSSNHPTVEVRCADVCLDAGHAAAIAGIVRALVETASREWRIGLPPPAATATQLRLAAWKASFSGTEGTLLHPVRHTEAPATEVIQDLLAHIRPVLDRWGEARQVESEVARVLSHGSGSQRQRQILMSTGSLRAVILDAVDRTHGRTPAADPRPPAPLVPGLPEKENDEAS
jgi:carboxylate-amine ligase